MTTEAERMIAMARLVNDAENSAYAAELELAAAEAELLQLREVVARQKETIEAQTHAAVCAHQEYRRVVAERDALCARLMPCVNGGYWECHPVSVAIDALDGRVYGFEYEDLEV